MTRNTSNFNPANVKTVLPAPAHQVLQREKTHWTRSIQKSIYDSEPYQCQIWGTSSRTLPCLFFVYTNKKPWMTKKGAVPPQGEEHSLQVLSSGVKEHCRHHQGCPQQEDWGITSEQQFQAVWAVDNYRSSNLQLAGHGELRDPALQICI